MKFVGSLLGILLLSQMAVGQSLQEKDLGILLPLESDLHLTVGESNGAKIFKASWLDAVNSGFRKTSVGGALEEENRVEDWKLVSLRMVPCSPIGTFPSQDQEEFCWPEIRQVWQPILKDVYIKWSVIRPFYADDRAIHTLFDVLPDSGKGEALRVLEEVRDHLKSPQGEAKIGEDLKKEFIKRRNIAIQTFVPQLVNLREHPTNDDLYAGIGVRPETHESESFQKFNTRLSLLLAKLAPVDQLKALTAFSLPAGRTPAATNEWIFLSFVGVDGELKQEDIAVTMLDEGPSEIKVGRSEFASMERDDPIFYDLIYENAELEESVRKQVLLFQGDRTSVQAAVKDRRQILVPNTSCGTCHKFNELRFNFHNFSYLEDLEASIAPRTVTDIQLDRQWSERFLGPILAGK